MTHTTASLACGLDFGTSNSTVGWHRPPQGALLALEDGKLTLPSAVFFHVDDLHASYGRAALKDYLDGHEGRLMRSLKSLLGTSMIDEFTELGGRALPFRKLLEQFIGELKRRGEHAAGREFRQGVLGRPVFFVDDDVKADALAETTLREVALAVGFTDVAFQFEPIAAAFDYESQIAVEELVLVVDIGGGTSDFSLVRLSPERAAKTDRRSDILANGGVHIGGTDFDKSLSLACVMPLFGLNGTLKSGRQMPSAQYFNLATWHTINFAYTRKALAETTLREVALAVGFTDVAFQFEPIAAAFDYESQIASEELVLVVDIGGGTSDFSLVRLSPERAAKTDRRSDILANGGVHIGGTDFDKYLSLACVMPLFGLNGTLKSGRQMPSAQYFNLATWHTINFAYTRKALAEIADMQRHAQDRAKLDRLASLARQRAGHWLALQVEAAKISLSDQPSVHIDMGRIEPGESLPLARADFDDAIAHLVLTIELTVQNLLRDAGVSPSQIDTVFFTGGSSSLPLLREKIAALLPDSRRVEGDLFGSIGAGLALDAKRKFG